MKKYNIVVNGTTYQVEVDEVGGASAPSAAPAPVAPAAPAPMAAAPAPAPVAPAAPAAAPSAGAQIVESPMPGTVLDVKVTPGQAVKAGDLQN